MTDFIEADNDNLEMGISKTQLSLSLGGGMKIIKQSLRELY